MTHRIVCIGDTHLKAGPRRAAKLAALDQIIDYGRQLDGLAAWAWPGDIFDAMSSIEDRNEVAERVQSMGDKAPVLIVQGNHDRDGDLDIFGKIKARWPIYVVRRPLVIDVPLATGALAAIACIPYPQKGSLVAAGVARDQIGVEAAVILDGICMEMAGILAEREAAGALPLVLGHGTIKGAISSVGQPMGLEHDIALDATMLARFAAAPKIFSHIHKAQEIFDAHYIGSITAMDWGELEDKRVIVVSYFDEDTLIESWPIDTPKLFHVEGNLTREAFTWAVTKGPGGDSQPPPATWRGCEVRVRYRYAQSEKAILSEAAILAEFAEAKRLTVESIAVPDRALRAPEVAAAHTLPDKFSAYCAIGGSPATPGMLEKLALLEHKDAAQVLSLVATTVAQIETPQEDQVLV